ncbi:23S rRNA pseudouridylate synthase [Brachybacterium sp. MASK1Z-5]|uniref:RNA pseudouridylate synthase n=1 Tax=Brachybacterium halotolerans TaxID=2795215 RepID=A0ABS1BDQ7_9MICO|nr:pseudouridine synthase [Brachybacterium halotolerans]MBK0332783.1 23S rRNA pseudouridylate synthase [Brachybacterium halotolerans]
MGRAARRRTRRAAPPLPQRHGLDPVRWKVGPTDAVDAADAPRALDALAARFPALLDPEATSLASRFEAGEVVGADGRAWSASDPVGPGDELWFHRELRDEDVDGPDPRILLHDAHLLVVDKPHDMATMPRGAHVLASALVRLRRATGIETLAPLHRLDRRTAGVLAFGTVPAERAAYQGLFARGAVRKAYLARVEASGVVQIPQRAGERFTMHDRLEKTHGQLQTRVVPGEPNAFTEGEVLQAADADVSAAGAGGASIVLRLHPCTGRTHQLRAQLAHRGAPIAGDDLYPRTVPATAPLALLSQELAFTDPVTGRDRAFRSMQELP